MVSFAVDRILSSSNVILFFSLPFRPAGKRNLFLSGHVALGIEEKVYQVYNPRLLKSAFLFSIMPMADWLFGKGGKWVERDPQSPFYRHVFLYGKSECKRTVVYCAGRTVSTEAIDTMRNEIRHQEVGFEAGRFKYGFWSNNCSSLIAQILMTANLIEESLSNLVPAFLFKSFAKTCPGKPDGRVGKIAVYDRERFQPHRLCAGVWGINPEKTMDHWSRSKTGPVGGRASTK